jgi:hypothetical protein
MKFPKNFILPITGLTFLDKDDQVAHLAADEMVEYVRVYPSDENIVAMDQKKGCLVPNRAGEAHITVVVKVSSLKGNRYIRSVHDLIIVEPKISSFGISFSE